MGFVQVIKRIYRPGGVFTVAATQRRAERALPLRIELFRPVLLLAAAALILQAGLLLWAGLRPDAPGLLFVSGFPAAWLVAAKWAIRQEDLRVFALAAVFTGIVLTAVLPIVQYQYPQYGGVMVLTIVLSGLLIGEFYVAVWTVICIVLQLGPVSQDWPTRLGWCAVYIVAGWLVILFSRHLERLLEANSEAEERQRSAIVAERTRFARDIHDTLAQGFTGVMVQLNAAEQRLPGDSGEVRAHIKKLGSSREKAWKRPGVRLGRYAARRSRRGLCWTPSRKSGISSRRIPASNSKRNSKASRMRCRRNVKQTFSG